MRNHKTPEQWQALIQQRQFFNGSNIDYCKKHHISVRMFYKKRGQFAATTFNEKVHITSSVPVPTNSNDPESIPNSPRFIPVLPSASLRSETTPANPMQTHFTYNTRSGVLTLPLSIPISDVVLLLQGIVP